MKIYYHFFVRNLFKFVVIEKYLNYNPLKTIHLYTFSTTTFLFKIYRQNLKLSYIYYSYILFIYILKV